jgi:uncharacterized protein YecE (DUF72 family)
MFRLRTPRQDALETAALSACFSTSAKMSFLGNFRRNRLSAVFKIAKARVCDISHGRLFRDRLNNGIVKVFVGVSGFSYPSWKGKFYPDDAKPEDFLRHYSQSLDSVEINSSFYAPPSGAMVKSWAAKTGDGFRFSFKAPKMITHIMKLGKGSPEASEKLSKTLDLLGPRRGPILFQLPPSSKLNANLLEEFLSKVADVRPRVFEFRHASWFEDSTYRLLDKYGAGFCIAETEDLGPTFKVTGGLAYYRLRKDSYDRGAIEEWSKKIKQTAAGSDDCYAYLRHDETGENALLAQELSKMLTD